MMCQKMHLLLTCKRQTLKTVSKALPHLEPARGQTPRSEACRGPGIKASRFFRSMVYQGKMIAAEVDKMNPEERKRLYKEMRLYKAKSSQLTTEIIRQHHAGQAEQFRGDGTNLLEEMLREGVWPDKDVEAVEPTTEEKRSIHSRILKDGMCLACGKQCDVTVITLLAACQTHAILQNSAVDASLFFSGWLYCFNVFIWPTHQRVLKEECQLDRLFGPPAGFGLRRWGSGCKVCTRKGLMEYFGDAVF